MISFVVATLSATLASLAVETLRAWLAYRRTAREVPRRGDVWLSPLGDSVIVDMITPTGAIVRGSSSTQPRYLSEAEWHALLRGGWYARASEVPSCLPHMRASRSD